jgi:FtsZ-interacting cell division protein ZipA
MNTLNPIDSVPADFLKNLLIAAGFLATMGINLYALWKSKREVSGMVRTQAVESFATREELRDLEEKQDAIAERILAAGERREHTITNKIEKQFDKFDARLLLLRAELRAEFNDLHKNAFQRLASQGERLSKMEGRTPPECDLPAAKG